MITILAFLGGGVLHPLHGNGYQLWSGIGSDVGEITIIVGMISFGLALWRRVECHQDGCHRIGRFKHGHYVLCHAHHPLVPSDGKITAAHIRHLTHDGQPSPRDRNGDAHTA